MLDITRVLEIKAEKFKKFLMEQLKVTSELVVDIFLSSVRLCKTFLCVSNNNSKQHID